MSREMPAFVAFAWGLFVGALVAIIFGGCAPVVVRERLTATVYVDEAESVRAALEDAWVATAALDVSALGGGGYGSGALVEARDAVALVLTAAHVVDQDTARVVIWVSFPDGKRFLGRVRREDRRRDLALVEVLGHVGVPPVRLAPAPPRRLERVWQLGAPDAQWGHVGEGRWGRLWEGRGRGYPLERMVTGGFEWDGMSGGPVVDSRGRLVAVNDTVHLADAVDAGDDDPEVRVPEMGGAVDWRDVRDFLAESGVGR